MPVSRSLLLQQDARTSTAVLDLLETNDSFLKLAKYEGDLTVTRDRQDDAKLQVGIDYAKKNGVIDATFVPDPYVQIDVLGQTPDAVAATILTAVRLDPAHKVIVLVGLSGTGKGTTVAKLRDTLQADGEGVVTWSNGNIFRSVTLLAATWCEQNCSNGGAFDKDKALTPDNVASFMNMLTFEKNAQGNFDTHIQGLGLDLWVSQVQNTELKVPKVSKNIPTVAEVTQGEVILFAAKAVELMGAGGLYVLLEGREQTVNYVRSPHRFALVLSDDTLIGKRRAAQRLMGAAVDKVVDEGASEADVETALRQALEEMIKEIA